MMPSRRFKSVVIVSCAMLAGACQRDENPPAVAATPGKETTAAHSPRPVDFGPGLRIDYRVPQVEIDAEVILREASLELFLYSKSPTPKEHESILRTRVPSSRIYQALGVAGFVPGQTMRYFPDTDRVRPPSGDPVEVFVRFERDGKSVEEPATEWMFDVNARTQMRPTHWLFTGSERTEEGQFAADIEGTVITVVDFPSSLLSLPVSHTSSDAQLWLKTNTVRIPPIGTKVVVILRAPGRGHAVPATQPA
jgi:hypothetical protein